MDLYLLNYKNYYDRKGDRITDTELQDHMVDVVANANFNPGDGIDTTHVVNTYTNCNYLVAVDSNEIDSRWYVTEALKTRNGQYKLTLKRDVIADYYDEIIDAPVFIEKATLDDADPMIFNNEGMTFNKIKQSETPLKQFDYLDTGWIVGYTHIPDPSTLKDTVKNLAPNPNITVVGTLDNWEYKDYATKSATGEPTKFWKGNINLYFGGYTSTYYVRLTNGDEPVRKKVYETPTSFWEHFPGSMTSVQNYVKTTLARNYFATYKGINNGTLDATSIQQLEGKIIKDSSTGKYYKVNVKAKSGRQSEFGVIASDAGALYNQLYNLLVEEWGEPASWLTNHNKILAYRYLWTEYYIYLEETVELSGDLCINHTDLQDFFVDDHKAEDADYMMFCFPCPLPGSVTTVPPYIAVGPEQYTRDRSMAVAQMLVDILQPSAAGGNLIDLQLLPYCPILAYEDIKSTLRVKDALVDGSILCSVYCFPRSSFSFNIDKSIEVDNVKISNECDVYRLVAPNYSSSFEFSPAKNGGVSFFHVNCTYKPYTPYINIHPYFEGLYGTDFEDNRGLILSGDYSLPLTSDTFTTYQIQNKNYSNIFDRQMQNMDIQNAWNMAEAIVGAGTGTLAGAAAGALVGGVPGAIVGGIASAGGGIADIAKTAAMQQENKSLAKDMYSFQLGNVDSKPNSLVKSSAFDISYKMWPYIEYLTCTEVERQALKDKLKYNGMTVCRIGKISEFLNGDEQYIQGQLIRLNLNDDSHMVVTISEALARGIYLK